MNPTSQPSLTRRPIHQSLLYFCRPYKIRIELKNKQKIVLMFQKNTINFTLIFKFRQLLRSPTFILQSLIYIKFTKNPDVEIVIFFFLKLAILFQWRMKKFRALITMKIRTFTVTKLELFPYNTMHLNSPPPLVKQRAIVIFINLLIFLWQKKERKKRKL